MYCKIKKIIFFLFSDTHIFITFNSAYFFRKTKFLDNLLNYLLSKRCILFYETYQTLMDFVFIAKKYYPKENLYLIQLNINEKHKKCLFMLQ